MSENAELYTSSELDKITKLMRKYPTPPIPESEDGDSLPDVYTAIDRHIDVFKRLKDR